MIYKFSFVQFSDILEFDAVLEIGCRVFGICLLILSKYLFVCVQIHSDSRSAIHADKWLCSSIFGHVNTVALRRPRLVLGWVISQGLFYCRHHIMIVRVSDLGPDFQNIIVRQSLDNLNNFMPIRRQIYDNAIIEKNL